MANVKRILTYAPKQIGDTVMATALYKSLRVRHLKARITLLSEFIPHPILEGLDIFDEIIPYSDDIDCNGRFDLTVLPAFCGKENVSHFFYKIKNSIMLEKLIAKRKRVWSNKWTGAYKHLLFCKHQIEFNAEIARECGYEGEIPSLYCPQKDPALFKNWKGSTGFLITTPLTYLSGHLNRFWLREHWLSLIRKINDRPLLLIGGPEDEAYVKSIAQESKTPYVVFSEPGDLTALCHNLELLITADGGGMHIASTTPVPIIALFGKSSPILLHPWTHPSSSRIAILSPNSCSPCDRSYTLRLREAGFFPMTCMRNLSPDDVTGAVDKIHKISKGVVFIQKSGVLQTKKRYLDSFRRKIIWNWSHNFSRLLLRLKPFWVLFGKKFINNDQNIPAEQLEGRIR